LKSVLVENNLMGKAGQIYNVNESGMPLEHHFHFVLAKKGNKNKVQEASSSTNYTRVKKLI